MRPKTPFAPRRTSPRIAMLGVGIMGAPMAANLARSGLAVTAWNRSSAKAAPLAEEGVEIAASAISAVAAAGIVILMLSDGPACDSVLSEVAGALSPDAIVVVMSSIEVERARDQAARLDRLGIAYVDAPVSGGEQGAIDASLTIMAGGAADVIARLRPVFEILGRVTHVGPVGCGQLAKLANQQIVGATICAVAEAFLLVAAAGGDSVATHAALQGGFADSRVLREHGARMLAGNFRPGAHIATQLKDLHGAAILAAKLGLDLPLTGRAEALFARAVERGDGRLDHSAVLLTLEALCAATAAGAQPTSASGDRPCD
jgi:2-hydroxy-3-oxopropionate reductase